MPAPVLYVGQGAPDGIVITMPATDDFDPTTVTGAVFHFTRPDGTQGTWTATFTGNVTELVATYVLSTGDLVVVGFWRVYAVATVPGGSKRSVVGQFQVKPADGL